MNITVRTQKGKSLIPSGHWVKVSEIFHGGKDKKTAVGIC